MAKRGKKSISFVWLLLVMLLAFAGAGAVAYYYTSGGIQQPRPSKKQPVVYTRPAVTPLPRPERVEVYLAAVEHGKAYLKPVETDVQEDSRPGKLNQAMEALIAEGQKSDEGELIPTGTRLLAPVDVSGDVATIDLSHEFVDNFPGGSDQEDLTLNCIAFTLVNNSDGDVRKVRILVEGETVDSLGGHYSLDEPIEPDPEMLKP